MDCKSKKLCYDSVPMDAKKPKKIDTQKVMKNLNKSLRGTKKKKGHSMKKKRSGNVTSKTTKKEKTKKNSKENTLVPTVKKEKEKKKIQNSGSSSSEEDSAPNGDKSVVNVIATEMNKFYMAGAMKKLRPNPSDFVSRLLRCERPDLFKQAVLLQPEECVILDNYLKSKGEIRSQETVVMKESETDDEKIQDKLSIIQKYNEGRFGAIYIVMRVFSAEEKVVTTNNVMVMKTSLRQSSASTIRLAREIAALRLLFDIGKKNSKEAISKRIVPMLYESRVLGIPFFIMPLMDANLEKVREEIGGKLSIPCAFFISNEILMALKPTNVVCHPTAKTQWCLIDFGDALLENRRALLSPPDGATLPFLAILGHQAAAEFTNATFKQDIESWFYILMDLIKPLSWKKFIEESDVLNAKREFWNGYADALSEYPSQITQIADYVHNGIEFPYKELSLLIKDGFDKNRNGEWKPTWIEYRKVQAQNK